MEAIAVSVHQLFTNVNGQQPTYVIPHFQRGYAWKKEQAETLLADLREALNIGATAYFIGAITTIHGNGDRYEVIDGQQRLTTMQLIAIALRERIDPPDIKDRRSKIATTWKQLDQIIGYSSSEDTPIQHTRSDDKNAFRQIWDGDVQGRGTHRIHEVYDHLMKCLAEIPPDTLVDFAAYFLQSTRLVLIHTQDEESSYQIFETLNNRGETLSPLDLIKNRIFRAIGRESLIEEGLELWDQALRRLESSNVDSRSLDTALQALFAVRFSIEQREWIEPKALYQAVKTALEEIPGQRPTLDWLKGMLADPSIKTWVQIYRRNGAILSAKPYADAVRGAAEYKVFWPVLYVMLMQENTGQPSDKKRENAINQSARLMYHYIRRVRLAGKVPVQKLGRKMAETAAILSHHDPSAWKKTIRQAIQEIDAETVGVFDDANFKGLVARKPSIDHNQAKLAFIDLVNARAQSDGERLESAKNLHLEHILPQRPDFSEWPHFTQDQHANYLNRLGNLTLLGEKMNTAISNGPYAKKTPEFAKCNYWITREIPTQYADWSVANIESRGQRLLDELARIWSLK